MYEDVPSSIMLDKTILIELVNENVIPLFLNKFTKEQSLLPFFFVIIIFKEYIIMFFKLLKKISLIGIIFIIFFELFSAVFSKSNLLLFNSDPLYFTKQFKGREWRFNSKEFGPGPWHKNNSSAKHKTRCFDVIYQSNNIGARDNVNYGINYFRNSTILVGDSFAEGHGVNFESTFFYFLKNDKSNTVNLGAGGSNPFQNLKRFEKLIKNKENINEIIYFFLPQNDWLSAKQNKDKENKKVTEIHNSNFYSKIINLLSQFTYSINTLKTAKYLFLNKDKSHDNWSYNYKKVNSIDYTFKKIIDILQLDVSKKTLVVIPTRKDFKNIGNNKSYKELYWYKKINVLSNKFNFKIIDLYDFSNVKEQYKYFHECDGHWNDYGNKFVYDIYKNHS
jgi:hypothetical protein